MFTYTFYLYDLQNYFCKVISVIQCLLYNVLSKQAFQKPFTESVLLVFGEQYQTPQLRT